MPAGTKRKASFAFPYERPSKISKKSSSTTVSRTLSKITKSVSVAKPPLRMPKFPTLRATKITEEVSESAPLSDKDSPTPPALRRASTLTLEDDSSKGTSKGHSRESSLAKPSSMSKKSSSFVEKGALVTRLSGLKSGSLIGETALATSTSLTKEPSLSKSASKESSTGRSVPSIPSGLTKFALSTGASKTGSLHVSASTLVTDVDETEMASALDSLKAHLSKEGSKKSSMSKSASKLSKSSSVRSTKSAGSDAATDKSGQPEAEMDTSVASDHADIAVHSGMMEVAISFDTTGSMYGSLQEVRAKVKDLVQRLQADIPGIRVAIIAHGDYCDENNYIVKWIDFGASLPELCKFVKTVGRTSGGDGPECYELVMQRAREVLSWSPGSKRVLIMIGDNLPHEPGYKYREKTYYINWRDECAALKEMNVKVYGVQAGYGCNTENEIKRFFEEMARITSGKRLTLQNFTSLFDVLMMVCYREGNPEMLAIYEQEILDRGERIADDIHALKNTFHGTSTPAFGSTSADVLAFGLGRGRSKARRPKVCKIGKTEVKPKAKKSKVDSGPGAVKAKGFDKKAKGGSVKINKPLARSAKKTILKKQIKKLGKTAIVEKREKLPDACMNKGPLKSIVWTNWVRALEPYMPAGKSKDKYLKLRTLKGFGLKKIFDGNLKTPAIYEVAVQTGSNKKYVVYFRIQKRGFRRPGLWATNLFRDKRVRSEIDNNISQGGSVYIRRGVPKAKSNKLINQQIFKAGEFIKDNYDYAWKKYIWRRTTVSGSKLFGLKHRLLKIKRKGKTYTLSNDTL